MASTCAALPRGEVTVAGGLRQRVGKFVHQSLVGEVDVAIDQNTGRPVAVQMVDAGVDGEVVRLLHDAESEAVPVQGARGRGHHVVSDLVLVHETQGGGNELNERGS